MTKKIQAKNKLSNGKQRKIDVDQILLSRRQLFLFETIDDKVAKDLVKKMIALDRINHQPIILHINSPGGCISDGFSIVDTMKGIQSPVFTFIIGDACSMAGIIAIAGDFRLMSQNSIWMAHDGSTAPRGKLTDIVHYGKHIEKLQSHMFKFLREHTKLNEEELAKARIGQLWLSPEECKERGIVDKIIENVERKVQWQREAKPTSSK